jgi:hypothetical protein
MDYYFYKHSLKYKNVLDELKIKDRYKNDTINYDEYIDDYNNYELYTETEYCKDYADKHYLKHRNVMRELKLMNNSNYNYYNNSYFNYIDYNNESDNNNYNYYDMDSGKLYGNYDDWEDYIDSIYN